MTTLSTKERYARFLESEFWKELSRRKRCIITRCERCGSHRDLQCHHTFYREDWYDTILSDLEVLCRPCHEKHHKVQKLRIPTMPRPLRNKKVRGKFAEFLRKKKKLQSKARSLGKPLKSWDMFRCTPIHHWTKRGTSSN